HRGGPVLPRPRCAVCLLPAHARWRIGLARMQRVQMPTLLTRRRRMSHPKTVQDCMTVAPYTVPLEMPIEVARRFMTDRRIRHLPVMRNRTVAGIVSEVSIL